MHAVKGASPGFRTMKSSPTYFLGPKATVTCSAASKDGAAVALPPAEQQQPGGRAHSACHAAASAGALGRREGRVSAGGGEITLEALARRLPERGGVKWGCPIRSLQVDVARSHCLSSLTCASRSKTLCFQAFLHSATRFVRMRSSRPTSATTPSSIGIARGPRKGESLTVTCL